MSLVGGAALVAISPPIDASQIAIGEGPSSIVTTAPSRAPLLAETPTPMPTPVPDVKEPVDPTTWQFTCASLTIPEIGMEHREITPYFEDQLVWKEGLDNEGNLRSYPAVSPPSDDSISWYASLQDQGRILSSDAQGTNAIYAHSSAYGDAPFNRVAELEPGDEATIDSSNCGGETLVYVVQEPSFNILKGQLVSDERVQTNKPGGLLLFTCYKDGERDENGYTINNSVVILQLKESAPPITEPEVHQNLSVRLL